MNRHFTRSLLSAVSLMTMSSFVADAAAADLQASFSAAQCEIDVLYNGFDSEEDLATWTQEGTYKGWTLSSDPYGFNAPAFSEINPSSKSSLIFRRTQSSRNEAIVSPKIRIQQGDRLSFWSVSYPIWLYNARTVLYVVDESGEHKLWDNFMWNQTHPTDDTLWLNFSYDLSDYDGKDVQLKFLYTGADGDDVMIDDVKVSRLDPSASAVTVSEGEQIDFIDSSEGNPSAWEWSFPGGTPSSSVLQNPTVTYAASGQYDVTLKVKDASGKTSEVTRKQFVIVQAQPLEAAIGLPEGVYFSPEAFMTVPLRHELTFTDLSKGNVQERTWLFPGTATPTASEASPTVYYTEPGTYDVDLKVRNGAGESTTYLYQVRAGLPTLAWNIPVEENTALAPVSLSWYGYYGGSNWLDMPAFAEHFTAPLEPAEISEVNVYFAAAKPDPASSSLPITVSICKSENGLPGEVLASASLLCSELIDASQTVNDPTTFTFGTPVTVTEDFFVTIGDFPNNETDNIAMYCSPRREDLSKSTVYHKLADLDADYQPTGTFSWVKNTDESLSFAIAPRVTFKEGTAAVDSPAEDAASLIDPSLPVEYYDLSGRRYSGRPSAPGVYILRQGAVSVKQIIR